MDATPISSAGRVTETNWDIDLLEKLKRFFTEYRPRVPGKAPDPLPEISQLEQELNALIETKEEVHTHPRGIEPLISAKDVENIGKYVIPKLDYDKIRRTMLLFDTRWINDQFESYIPDNEQIAVFAVDLAVRLLRNGRIIGPCIMRDRSFLASYGYGEKGEIISLEYILTGANNVD
jgi:hypothetical protein